MNKTLKALQAVKHSQNLLILLDDYAWPRGWTPRGQVQVFRLYEVCDLGFWLIPGQHKQRDISRCFDKYHVVFLIRVGKMSSKTIK